MSAISNSPTYLTIEGTKEGVLNEMDFQGQESSLFSLLVGAAAANSNVQDIITQVAAFIKEQPEKFAELQQKYSQIDGTDGSANWTVQLN